MSQIFENPFADYGNRVSGARFIGRKSGLQGIEKRVLRPAEPGNLAILGIPGIGKRSLVSQAIFAHKQELLARRCLPMWIDLATYEQPAAFFRSLVKCCIEELTALQWSTPLIERVAQGALQEDASWSDSYGRVQRFFEKVRLANIRVLFVLDTFDSAVQVFKDDASSFLGIAELSSHPECRVAFVTISFRSIRDIEMWSMQTKAPPRLERIFEKLYVGMFDDEDMQEYYGRLAGLGLSVTPSLKESIETYAGGHPYLLDALSYQLMELLRGDEQVDVKKAAWQAESAYVEYMRHLTDMLREDGSLGKLLQAIHGYQGPGDLAAGNGTEVDVGTLLRYGVVKKTAGGGGGYEAFCERFGAFLQQEEWTLQTRGPRSQDPKVTVPLIEPELDFSAWWTEDEEEGSDIWSTRDDPGGISILPGDFVGARFIAPLNETDLWSLWRETEKTLRVALAAVFSNCYGDYWFARLEELRPHLGGRDRDGKSLFERCRETRQREEGNWPGRVRVLQNPLDFTSSPDLFALVFSEWEACAGIFRGDLMYWQRRFQLLMRVRILLAHNREEALYVDEPRYARIYCEEVLEVLRPWSEDGDAINRAPTLWGLWRETEEALRAVTAAALRGAYGEAWFSRVELARADVGAKGGRDGKNVFQRCRAAQQREAQILGYRSFASLLDFAYPQDLFVLLFAEWWLFKPILGKDWIYWEPRAQVFSKLRNPLAHNREELLDEHDSKMAVAFCEEILAPLRVYMDTL